uniref:Uncharacterized protein n=1 Tax=Ciona intestinalis TaxID=7719 RepID=H2Y2N1_CIOIN
MSRLHLQKQKFPSQHLPEHPHSPAPCSYHLFPHFSVKCLQNYHCLIFHHFFSLSFQQLVLYLSPYSHLHLQHLVLLFL